jgi:hypothetical protein
MNRRFHSFSIWLIAVVYAVMSAGGSNLFYMCVTEDGHVRLENVLQGKCLMPEQEKRSPELFGELLTIAQSDGCGACTDFSLSMVLHIRQELKSQTLPLKHFEEAIYFSAEYSSASILTPYKQSAFAMGPNTPPDILGSIVLLI